MTDNENKPAAGPLKQLGSRLAQMLDDDQWNNIEPLLNAVADSAPKASAVPEGWKLVPIEPTPEMTAAAMTGAKFDPKFAGMFITGLIANWRKMLAAAPQAEEAPALPTVEEFLARLLPPPGYESHKVIERDGKLMFCLPADIQPTDGFCFYDGDMRDVVKPDTAPKRVQPSIDTSEFRTITDGIRPKDYIEIVAYIDAKLTQARIEIRQESVNRRLALEHRLAKMEDRAIAAEEKLASIRAALDK